jgi:hypothetical protein
LDRLELALYTPFPALHISGVRGAEELLVGVAGAGDNVAVSVEDSAASFAPDVAPAVEGSSAFFPQLRAKVARMNPTSGRRTVRIGESSLISNCAKRIPSKT